MAKYHFYLNSRKDAHGKRSILLYVRAVKRGDKTPIVVFTQESINENFWDKRQELAKHTYIGHPQLNRLLLKIKEDATAIVRTLLAEGKDDYVVIKSELQKMFEPKQKIDFREIYEKEYLQTKAESWQDNTIKKFQTLGRYFEKYERKQGYAITFEQIGKPFYEDFRLFLTKDVGLLNNSANKLLKMLRMYMKWALEKEYHKNERFKIFEKARYDQTEIIHLTEAELERLYSCDFSDNPTLDKVRDVFCFQCFTGQRFSDIRNFKYEDVRGDVWNVRTVKTRDSLAVPLTTRAKYILEKYQPSGSLPVISAQKTNQYLKEVCEIAGINEPTTIVRYQGKKRVEHTEPKWKFISTHTARRTFVSLSIAKGVPAKLIMEITGHKSDAMLNRYLNVSEKTAHEAIKKAWQ